MRYITAEEMEKLLCVDVGHTRAALKEASSPQEFAVRAEMLCATPLALHR